MLLFGIVMTLKTVFSEQTFNSMDTSNPEMVYFFICFFFFHDHILHNNLAYIELQILYIFSYFKLVYALYSIIFINSCYYDRLLVLLKHFNTYNKDNVDIIMTCFLKYLYIFGKKSIWLRCTVFFVFK